jgi:hypothetical protein
MPFSGSGVLDRLGRSGVGPFSRRAARKLGSGVTERVGISGDILGLVGEGEFLGDGCGETARGGGLLGGSSFGTTACLGGSVSRSFKGMGGGGGSSASLLLGSGAGFKTGSSLFLCMKLSFRGVGGGASPISSDLTRACSLGSDSLTSAGTEGEVRCGGVIAFGVFSPSAVKSVVEAMNLLAGRVAKPWDLLPVESG